ncbi:hypothetical protein M409DRAFT_16814 [Zasmidium cellare ATCC 36951]|uniref:Uncharacterized protein n=1 Tax=Zasmidium cellare ATCC 36951 TaxID=1080233 RepID=A0A6A6D393_ZASCE|nr:uncharacterized protein M409DRAFT_16814 [Zasmidium cellare ATCC 36951]KAF2172860.1 hypothetical protein M409DRAFT_16814 [Zasmidium cellare ATCC 36951]
MPSTRPNPLDLNNATPRRLPRLAVRNKSPDEVVASETSQSGDDIHGEIQPVPVHQHTLPTVRRVPSKPILKTDQRHHRHDSKDSNASDYHPRGRQPSKRKSSGVLSFLTLKEPSTSALDQFAEHERKKTAQKGAKSVTAVMAGVSSQKLPDHVPKVNSKWDGLPESTKRDQRDTDRMKRSSIISMGSSGRGQSPRRRFGSTSSKPAVRQSQDKKRTTVQVAEIKDDRPMSARTMDSPPPPIMIHPALRGPIDQTFLHSPSHSADHAWATSPELDLPELPTLQDRDFSSGAATSPDASPRTPVSDPASIARPKDSIKASAQLNSAMDPTATFWLTDSDEVMVKSAGPDVLEPPTSYPTLRSPLSATRVEFVEPIAEERDVGSKQSVRIISRSPGTDASPGLVRNFSRPSNYFQQRSSSNISSGSSTVVTPPVHSPTFSAVPSPSTRPTTMASSIAPADRAKSVSPIRAFPSDTTLRDRPCQAPQIKKNEVLPWEMVEPPPEPATSTKQPSTKNDSGKLKRLSYKLGKK